MYDVFNSSLSDVYSYIISYLVDVVIELWPLLAGYIGVLLAQKLFISLTTPKYDGPVFDDNYAKDFDLMYDAFADEYESEEDFINDYMSDFTAFQDEPELDELVELDIWDTLSYDYDDPETLYIKQYDVDFDISYDDYDGSFTDYVENSELE